MSKELSRRERQIMDIIHRGAQVTAAEVRSRLPDPPSYSSVRTLLRVLEDKGHVRHKKDGQRYVYYPRESRERARRSAFRRLLRTFCGDSVEEAVAALLDMEEANLTQAELDRLAQMIEEARKKEQ